jgi:hypothetical protein
MKSVVSGGWVVVVVVVEHDGGSLWLGMMMSHGGEPWW